MVLPGYCPYLFLQILFDLIRTLFNTHISIVPVSHNSASTQLINHTSVLVCFSTKIYVASANNSKPTMTATAVMGNIPTPFKYKVIIQLTSILLEEEKCPNTILCNNQKPPKTISSIYHHVENTVAKSMAATTTTNHHEQQPPVNLPFELQQGIINRSWFRPHCYQYVFFFLAYVKFTP